MNLTFAAKLKAAMERTQCTQSDLVAKTGISRSCISQYCSGKNRPSSARIATLETALGVPEGYFTVRAEKVAQGGVKFPDGLPEKITVAQVARYMRKSERFVKDGVKCGALPFGIAIQGVGEKYTYFINPILFFRYLAGDLNDNLKVNFQNGKITVNQAALLMGKSVEFIQIGLQQKALPFGAAVQLDPNTWDYYISPKLFADFVGVELNDG